MSDLTQGDAIRLAVEYYEKKRGYPFDMAVQTVGILAKADVDGLVQYAYRQAVLDMEAEK